jgi:hypothetical protein
LSELIESRIPSAMAGFFNDSADRHSCCRCGSRSCQSRRYVRARRNWTPLEQALPWILGAVAGSAIYYGSGFIKEQVLAYREGRHV